MRFSINPETPLHPNSPSTPNTEIPEEESFDVKTLQKDDILDVNSIFAEMFESSDNPEMNKVLQEFLEDRTLPSDTLGLLLVKNTVPLMVIWPVTSELDSGMYSSLTRLINILLGRKSFNDTPSLNNPPDINPIYENMFDDKLSDNNHVNIKLSDGKTVTIQPFENEPIGDALPLIPDEIIYPKNTFYNNFSKDNSTDVYSTNDKHISNQPLDTLPLIPGKIESHTNGLMLRAFQISEVETARRTVGEFLRSLNDLTAIQILELYLKSQTISTPSGTVLLKLVEPPMYLLPLNVQEDRRGKRTLDVGISSTHTPSGGDLGGDKGPFVHRLASNPVVEGSIEVVPLDEIQGKPSAVSCELSVSTKEAMGLLYMP
uniref:Uncharacterized protein n=1 Tax=Timema cristinae TaxID=61476 RepID=A0A7R9H5L8_TIMCR|nr:unnamed protein product [Timema cristinae]